MVAVENERIAEIDQDDLIAFLQSGATSYHCGQYIYHLNGVERTQLYQELETERIDRKYHDLKEQYHFVGKDWNGAMFVMLMRTLADKYNKANYMEIAYRIGYTTLMHERDNIENIEALLIATSGLIDTLPIDSFTDSIRRRGSHLLHKYSITPLLFKQWKARNVTVTKAPILRFIQVAQLFFHNDFLFNRVIACRTRDDIFSLFNVPARDEWTPYFGGVRDRKIGVDKCDLFGINVVIPILYTFGHQAQDDMLTDAANDLNESIPAEKNYYITGWRKSGLNPTIAYESQALIQLASEYCLLAEAHKERRKRGEVVLSRCEECPIYKHLCSRASIIERVPSFLE